MWPPWLAPRSVRLFLNHQGVASWSRNSIVPQKSSAFYGKGNQAGRSKIFAGSTTFLKPRSIAGVSKKYGDIDLADAKRLKALEKENAELKKMLAESMLKNRVLEEVNAKNW